MSTTETVTDQVAQLIAEAAEKVEAAVALCTTNDITAEPDINPLQGAIGSLRTAAMHSRERADRTAAGMNDEPDWFDGPGVYPEIDPTWNCVVTSEDGSDRYPRITVTAPTAYEANRRAVTYANITLGLGEAIPIDGPRERLAGRGTRSVGENRWEVSIEGW